jgi:hypothetical protein
VNDGEVGTSAWLLVFTSMAVTCSSLKDASRLVVTASEASHPPSSHDDQEPPL